MIKDAFLLNAEQKNTQHLLSLEPLRFLAHFYTTAGLPRPLEAVPYEFLNDEPTWERSESHNFRGHMFGHYMSALALSYSASDDEKLKRLLLDKITICIIELKKCQDTFALNHPSRAGYIGPFGDGRLDELDGMSGGVGLPTSGQVWVPWYNLHKVLAGLNAVYEHVTDNYIGKLALDVAVGFGKYFYNMRASQYTSQNRQQLLHIEYGGMNDAFYDLYRLTGDDRFKFCAECFDEVSLFDAIAEGRDVLPGKHANTQIPKFIGALKRYTTLLQAEQKDLPKYLLAAKNFFDIVLSGHTYITGGNSAREHFHQPNTLSENINRDDTHETCNGYNMLKLARELFKVTKDKKYADYYENVFINVILSSQNPETGAVTYFQPMGSGYNKLFGKNRFWCCNGTGIESFAKLQDSIYFADDDNVFVNMYFSSEFIYAQNNLKLSQVANMPNSDVVTLKIDCISNEKISSGTKLCFRVPGWCAGNPTVKVNGVLVENPDIFGGYIVISDFARDDEIQLTFPMEVAIDALNDNPNIVAFRYGPVVLSAAVGDWNMAAISPNGIMVLVAVRDSNAPNMIEIADGVPVDEWKAKITQNLVRIEDSADGLIQFKLKGTNMDDKLIYTPHYRQYKQRYALYITLADEIYLATQALVSAETEAPLNKEGSSAYLTAFDNHAYEGEFNMQSSGSGTGMWNDKSFRHAQGAGSWFSYELPITYNQENYLNVMLTRADNGRSWDIFINDEYFDTEKVIDADVAGAFYVSTHRIPDKFLAGEMLKTKMVEGKTVPYITVKFQHRAGSVGDFVGGIFGMSIT